MRVVVIEGSFGVRHAADLQPPARLWRFGAACFDEAARTLIVAGSEVEIERRPLDLLALLLEHTGEVVTKGELLDALWPDREVTEASLAKCVSRLRAALGDADTTMVRTVHGYGYRFEGPVTVEDRGPRALILPAAQPFSPGDMVAARPDWRLIRRLDTGGHGDAWLAEQARTGERRVFKFASDGPGLKGLRREVALFRLLREGLGRRGAFNRLLDWNLTQAPYFIETEWIAGGNLADWCAARGGPGAVPLAIRIDLAAQIADALAAVHGLGVLHKDLKPGNVLIGQDDDGAPRIILSDFGSGHALDPTRLEGLGITRFDTGRPEDGVTSGTGLYGAPELLAGGLPTIQADIYSLGVLLFQLAAGDLRRPMAPGWEWLLEDALLRADIADAAAGDPARRLADAAAFARRLRALPERRAAAARAAAEEAELSRARRALERARARRGPLAALVAVLLVGLVGSSVLYLRAQQSAARARAVTRFLTDDLLSAANPALAADPNVPISRVLAVAASDLSRRFAADNLDRAAIEAAIGGAYAGLADATHGQPLLTAALATYRAKLGDRDPQTLAVRLAMAALAERVVDGQGMRAAGQAVLDARPADPETRIEARYDVLAGRYLADGNGYACATPVRVLLAEARRQLGADHPTTLKIQSQLAECLCDSARAAEAVTLASDAATRTEQRFGPDHLLVQERRFLLGVALVQAHREQEAAPLLEDVRRRLLVLTGSETELSARVENQLGMADQRLERYADAEALYRRVVDFSLRTRGRDSVMSQAAISNLAGTLAAEGRAKDAVPLAREVFETARRQVGADNPRVLWYENNLADELARAGQQPEAEALFTDLVARGRRVFAHGEYDPGIFMMHLGEVLHREGRTDAARKVLSEGVSILRSRLGAQDKRTLRAEADLAGL
jgi:non-specific serine/threonine protein kinase